MNATRIVTDFHELSSLSLLESSYGRASAELLATTSLAKSEIASHWPQFLERVKRATGAKQYKSTETLFRDVLPFVATEAPLVAEVLATACVHATVSSNVVEGDFSKAKERSGEHRASLGFDTLCAEIVLSDMDKVCAAQRSLFLQALRLWETDVDRRMTNGFKKERLHGLLDEPTGVLGDEQGGCNSSAERGVLHPIFQKNVH